MYHGAERHKGDSHKGIDLLQVYPTGFAFFCMLIFVTPVVKCVDLAFDIDVAYWMGYLPMIAALSPPAFTVLAFFVNKQWAASSKAGTVLALIGSGIALLVLGDQLGSHASLLADRFTSLDCRGFPDSMELEKQLVAAKAFYKQCLASTPDLPIQDCPNYDRELDHHSKWDYLASMEMRFACTGWCEPREPLWNYGALGGDRCGVVVGQLMRAKVHRTCSQILTWSLCLVALTSVALALLLPAIRKAGLDW